MSEFDPASAASGLAHMIRSLVPDWTESSEARNSARWTDPDPDSEGTYVEIDGRLRDLVPVADPMIGKHVGPQLTGYCNGITAVIILPDMVDRSDLRAAIAAMRAIYALPAGAKP